MMPPYGSPYGAMYAHGGVYTHHYVPHGAHSQSPAVSASPVAGEAMVATPLSASTPAKSLSNKKQGLMKKLKGFDGLVVSLGNGDVNGGSGDMSQRDYKTDGSSDGSDGNTARVSSESVTVGRVAIGNLIGGIGYFYGQSKISLAQDMRDKYGKDFVQYWPAEIYTDVPGRTTFPRGFL